ncbi:3974_t:CDS:2 [Rhizophagus irregularis]|nr:3974_t:CDS:2 [Rhizophagus irregularis]
MAAGFVESIIKNHPFIDGNKRAAHLAVGMFLSLNDYFLNMDEASVIEITQGVATGDQELCQKKIDNLSISNIELTRQYNVKPNTVSDILKRKSEYLFISSSELKRKRFKQPMYKEIDDAVGIWMSQKNDENNLNDAIQKLPYNNTLSGLEYINVDKLDENEILLEDNEIVETVRLRHYAETVQDNNENEFIFNISLSDVLSSIEKLITFHNFLSENYEITSDELKILKGIRRKDNFTIHSETVWKETMRDCILKKGVTFDVSYRKQKAQITNGIVHAAPDFPPTRADWAIKELLINNFQRYFKKKRDHKNAKVVDGNRNSNEENNENHDSEIGETNNSEDRGKHDSISEPVQNSTRRSEKAK